MRRKKKLSASSMREAPPTLRAKRKALQATHRAPQPRKNPPPFPRERSIPAGRRRKNMPAHRLAITAVPLPPVTLPRPRDLHLIIRLHQRPLRWRPRSPHHRILLRQPPLFRCPMAPNPLRRSRSRNRASSRIGVSSQFRFRSRRTKDSGAGSLGPTKHTPISPPRCAPRSTERP